MEIITQLCQEFSLPAGEVKNTLGLLDQGATIPFIARYRKEQTGNLDEVVLRQLNHSYAYYQELEERRRTVLSRIADQGKLTPKLQKQIERAVHKTELEDLYLPFRPRRKTRAVTAREAGLLGLARALESCRDPQADLEDMACSYVDPQKKIPTVQAAIQGASDILAEELAMDAGIRKWIRHIAWERCFLKAEPQRAFKGKKSNFSSCYGFCQEVRRIPSHRLLALLRGEREKVLALTVTFPHEEIRAWLLAQRSTTSVSRAVQGFLCAMQEDALKRLLYPAIETGIRRQARERAEEEAIKVFAANVRHLLLAPPAGQRPTLGIDPGFRTGCKVAVVDREGNFQTHATIYPHAPHEKKEEAARRLRELIEYYTIELIAVGNGTAGRETERFVQQVLSEADLVNRPECVLVSEAGASVYSASEIARREFGELDLTVRGAISIARRLQDPLSELVKIDPKAIGVGQYQHDVNQVRLRDALQEVVESCVNSVGVNLNLASVELLRHVAGLSGVLAESIVAYRTTQGAFTARAQLCQVPGIGPRTFEQAAGFLRIPGAVNPLDNSGVHPERYAFVEEMAASQQMSVRSLMGNTAALAKISRERLADSRIGRASIDDIFEELKKPGRDPRRQFRAVRFNPLVSRLEDLTPGMVLQGSVTNVTRFGAFVDIGVHQDGLVHISELADRFVRDPDEIVNAGKAVTVRVLSIDKDLSRIALSMRNAGASQEHGWVSC